MKSYQVDSLEREEIRLVGFSITESLNAVLESKIIGSLREDLEKRMNEIENRKGSGIYLIQIYPYDGHWTHHVPYQHVIGFEVTSYGEISNEMITHTVPSGRYIKIIHKGAESKISATYEFINNTYGCRPIDIEYWHDIHALESEAAQIDIYIPAI
ncbi:MAG TPA: effector binding domain-containing protein [Candidatus Udaeobacter sp.]|nr:effector binding domain-containing protein [Candidatus Udaeobacter sp.]